MVQLLTYAEAADTQKTWTVSYLRRAQREGRLLVVKHGRFHLIHPDELERFRLDPSGENRSDVRDSVAAYQAR